jgi:hypothetical protein
MKKLFKLIENLNSAHPSKPTMDALLNKLTHLHWSRLEALEFVKFNRNPGQANIWEDLKGHDCFLNHMAQVKDDTWTGEDFWKGWLHLGDGGSPGIAGRFPLVAMDVRCSSLDGLKGCFGSQTLPGELSGEEWYYPGKEEGEMQWEGFFTPAGSITGPHVDAAGYGNLIVGVYGWKVLVWWDASEEILEEFAAYHCNSDYGDISMMALDNWPKGSLHWAVLIPGKYKILPPGTVHMVFSPSNSAVVGFSVGHEDWLKEGLVKRIFEWEIELEKSLKDKEKKREVTKNIDGQFEFMKNWMKSEYLSQIGMRQMRSEMETWKNLRRTSS